MWRKKPPKKLAGNLSYANGVNRAGRKARGSSIGDVWSHKKKTASSVASGNKMAGGWVVIIRMRTLI